jgi:exonuclease SbcD
MNLLLTGDWHLRENIPTCRTDAFLQTQWQKLSQVWDIAREYGCDAIVLAGDLCDRPRPSLGFVYQMMVSLKQAPCPIYSIAGNHDLPGHSMSELPKSAYGLAAHMGLIKHIGTPVALGADTDQGSVLLCGASWGAPMPDTHPTSYPGWRKLAVIHEMVLARPGGYIEGAAAAQKATDLSGFDFVLAGHNHTPFYFPKRKGRAAILSPGPISRQNAAEIDRHPSVYILNSETLELQTIKLQIDPAACSREHLDAVLTKDARISRFVDSLEETQVMGLDYVKNMMDAIQQETVSEATRRLCATILQGEEYEFGTATLDVEKGSGKGDDRTRPSGRREDGPLANAEGPGAQVRRRRG